MYKTTLRNILSTFNQQVFHGTNFSNNGNAESLGFFYRLKFPIRPTTSVATGDSQTQRWRGGNGKRFEMPFTEYLMTGFHVKSLYCLPSLANRNTQLILLKLCHRNFWQQTLTHRSFSHFLTLVYSGISHRNPSQQETPLALELQDEYIHSMTHYFYHENIGIVPDCKTSHVTHIATTG